MAQKQENYLKMPNSILNLRGLGKGPKMLLAHIYSYGRKGCWQSNATLGKMFYVSERTITQWIAQLKQSRQILWLHPKGYYRTLWAKSHPDVLAAQTLLYRGGQIPKANILSGHGGPTPLRTGLPSESAEICEVTQQKRVVPLGRNLPQTKNTTWKDTQQGTQATPTPLPAGGQAPALLEDRRAEAAQSIERMKMGFGRAGGRRADSTSAEDRAGREAAERDLERIQAVLTR